MSEEKIYPRSSGMPGQHIDVQTFSAIATGPVFDDFVAERTRIYTWKAKSGQCDCNSLYRINSRGRGILRQVIGGSTTNLSRDTIEQALDTDTPPASSSLDYQGQLILRVNVAPLDGIPYFFFADVGQAIEVYTACPTVDLLGPSNAVLIAPGTTVTLAGGTDAFYYDSLTALEASKIDAPITQRIVRYTQRVGIPTGTTVSVEVPPRAEEFTIFTTSAVGSWTANIGDPAVAGFAEQTLTFSGAGVVSGEVGNSTHLRSDTVAADRLFTIVWGIRP